MDPRKPELAVSRMNELMKQFDGIMSKIKVAEVSNKLGEMEREGSLVIQEICLVAPRLHEAMMQASRTRRFTLSHPPVEPMEKSFHRADIVTDIENPYGEIAIHNANPEEYIEMPKKKVTKKKTSKKKAE